MLENRLLKESTIGAGEDGACDTPPPRSQSYLQLSRYIFGTGEHLQGIETAGHVSWRLLLIYFALCSLGIGSMIYQFGCPDAIRPVPAAARDVSPVRSPLEERRFEPSVPLATVSLDDRGGQGAAGRSRAGGHRSLGPRPIRPQLAPLRASGNAASPTRPPSDTARPSCPSGSSAVATG